MGVMEEIKEASQRLAVQGQSKGVLTGFYIVNFIAIILLIIRAYRMMH